MTIRRQGFTQHYNFERLRRLLKMKPYSKLNNAGFTLAEIIIALAIIVMLSTLALFLGFDFYRGYSLRSDANNIVSVLRRARNNALDNVNEAPHGVFINSSTKQLIIFQGNSYAARNPTFDGIFMLAPLVTPSGLQEVVFSQLSGDSNASGTITLATEQKSLNVSINHEGGIDW